ncbi:MAG: outer membrane beta-barrel protein [Gammaproteobacteria bacterium]|nr:outer membrane beta-barrel protein [Gammaproteobacteria bacterium]
MKNNLISILFLVLLSAQASVQAAKFNYNKISLGYADFTVEMIGISDDLKADGYDLTASFDANKQFAVTFGIANAAGDVNISGSKVGLDVDAKMLGILFHAPVSQKTDVLLGAALLLGEVKAKVGGFPATKNDKDGQLVSIGVRTMLSDKLELNVGADQSFFDGETDTGLNLGVEGYMSKHVSLGLHFSSSDDSQSTIFSASKYF